jgi:type I restriction enzyme S subunit
MKKAYPKYSKTNIPWLRFMPDHWDDVKVKFLFKERVEKGFPDEPLLAATQTQGVVPKELYENRTVTAQKDFHLLKLVEVGDFVISLRSFQGGIEYAYYRGIISPAYTVMKPLPEVFGGYFKYLFKSKHFVDDLTTYVTGIREGQNIDYSAFRDSFQPLPPLPEQRQIAAFLDHKCALIDTFIQKKTRLIELLKEQKQAIINKAVTKGIDPNVRLKPSGIDWLGDIPEHWEVKKLKYLSLVNPSKKSLENVQDAVFLPMEKVSEEGEIDCEIIRPIEELGSGYTYFEKDDIILAKITPCFENGKGAYLNLLTTEVGFGSTEFHVLRPNRRMVDPKFLHFIVRSEKFRSLGEYFMIGSAGQKRVPTSFVSNYFIGFPDLSEQRDIVEFINQESRKIDNTVEKILKEVTLLQEYKTTLIAEAVTGKIDVREWKPKQVAEEVEQPINQVQAYGSN